MTRERQRDERLFGPRGGGPEGGGDTEGLEAAAEHFLRQADRAIERALSGDSEAFLRANRQHGGE
jgi:hypothetical protein